MVMDGVGMVFLELPGRGETAREDMIVNGSQIVSVLFELAGADGNKFIGQEWVSEVWNEEHCQHNVEWEDRLYSMCHVERGMACGFASGDMISPKDIGHDCCPTRGITIACLDEGIANGVVLSLDNAICSGIVG